MGHLQESLNSWAIPRQFRVSFTLKALPKARKRITAMLSADDTASPPDVDIERAYRKFRAISNRELEFGLLTRRDLKTGVWTVFRKFSDGLAPLCENQSFMHSLIDEIEQRGSPKSVAALILNFLEEYPCTSIHFEKLSKLLSQALVDAGPRLADMQRRVKELALLEEDGPDVVTDQIMNGKQPISAILESAYLVNTRAQNGFIAIVHEEVCHQIAYGLENNLLDDLALSRVLEFCKLSESDRALRISHQRVELANALLSPFLNQSPEVGIREQIKTFVLDHYGDPRTQKAKWQGIPQDSRAVLIRWLVQDTFEDFCRIVDLTQDEDPTADRQWPYRRAFWLSYFKQDAITDAWLVLGDKIATRASKDLGIKSKTYGTLSGGQASHAVLVLKIGDFIITEWSHSGKYRMWHETSANAPKLYFTSYHRDDLVQNPDLDGSHHGAENGTWQSRLADDIRRRTGVGITRRDYMTGIN